MNLTVMTSQGSVVRDLEAPDLETGAKYAENLGFDVLDTDGDKTVIVAEDLP